MVELQSALIVVSHIVESTRTMTQPAPPALLRDADPVPTLPALTHPTPELGIMLWRTLAAYRPALR